MRTRLCNGEDEEKLLEAVRETANIEQSTKSDFVPAFKQLSERMKAAGDTELLDDAKKNVIEGRELCDTQLPTQQTIIKIIPNNDQRPLNGKVKEEKKDDSAIEVNGYIVSNGDSTQDIDNKSAIVL